MWLLWRAVRYWWQRRSRGWDDSETWSLDWKLATWLAPRLRRFRELKGCYPGDLTRETWNEMLDEMSWAAEWYRDHAWDWTNREEFERARRGWKLIADRLSDLWW